MYVHPYGGQRFALGIGLATMLFLRQGLSLAWVLIGLIKLGRLLNSSQEYSCLPLPGTGITNMCPMPCLFCMSSEDGPLALFFHGLGLN